MSLVKAVVWGIGVAVLAMGIILLAGILFGLRVDVPGVISLGPVSPDMPSVGLQLSPLVPIGLAAISAATTWSVPRLRGRRQ
ncbi:MAG: hypothetical protein ACRDXB_02975 [Actinomycetes bacterium]